MKTEIPAILFLSLTLAAAERASEAVVTQSRTNIVRLVSVCPQYEDESGVALLSLTETLRWREFDTNGVVVVDYTTKTQWTLDAINALPSPWTNKAGVVVTNNAYKAQLLNLWTRFDNHPESVTIRVKQPHIAGMEN